MLKKYTNEIPRVPKGIKKIQEVGEELYLYGNSTYARDVLSKLLKYQVKIKAVLVSKEFLSEDIFEGYSVYDANEYIENCIRPITIIAGFSAMKHGELVVQMCKNSKIEQIFILNGCEYLFWNHFRFPQSKVVLIDNYYDGQNGLLERDLSREYYTLNYNLFLQTYEWLEDEKSKRTMEAYLSGHVELLEFPMLDVWKEEDVDNQYFPEDIVSLTEQEVFVDCGAYTGDTLESFLKRVKNYKKYYALEPDFRRFSELKAHIHSEKIRHIPFGAWNKKDKLYFSTDNVCGEISDNVVEKGDCIEVDTIDSLIPEGERVSFIKMDIEGAELPALQGAERTIKMNKPKLAICVYHKREDLVTIPQFIKSIVSEYKFYLRAHFPYPGEVVLYGICD